MALLLLPFCKTEFGIFIAEKEIRQLRQTEEIVSEMFIIKKKFISTTFFIFEEKY